ncbi:MAG: 3-dehydroquinate synthase [Bacteroidales bacterium]|nr:3-dehydroquinate synthase [Bacteroidales bacterium]
MKTLEVKAESKSSYIHIGEGIQNLSKYINDRKSIILTDSNIIRLYKNDFPKNIPVIEIGLGEKNKTLNTINYIMAQLVKYEADRTTLLVAIGGGIVSDVGGFAASVYMRGIPFGFVSTTLLSQVDASVGGKNGVNHEGYKNMIGVFNQPEFVICDTSMLSTLDEEEFRSGFAEIIKAGAIKDVSLFNYCSEYSQTALDLNPDAITHMVYESVKIKANIVEADEREKGERRLLNFGHTFAHALEKMTGILHGKAVSIGMVLAAKVSNKLGIIDAEDAELITTVLNQYGLPVKSEIPEDQLFSAMKQDKKRTGDSIHLVLLEKIGHAVTREITYNELQKIINDLRCDI